MVQAIVNAGSVFEGAKPKRNTDLKIRLVGFYDGLYFIGIRRLSAYTKQFYKDVGLYLYNVKGYGAFLKDYLFKPKPDDLYINPDLLRAVADADVVGISSMSNYSRISAEFVRQVRKINPSCYIIWGGTHAIMDPGKCIPLVDAVCVGEGEKAFIQLLDKLHTPEMYKVPGLWFRSGKEIIRNPARPLYTPAEFNALPYLDYSEDVMYLNRDTFRKLDGDIYLHAQGPSYMTLWSIGCPFSCSYCGNTKFLNDDKKYAKLRYTTPEYIVGELKHVLNRFSFINFIEFDDDNFFLIKNDDIVKFAHLYKKEIGLPFHVPGIFPGTVKDESTLDLLIDAGLRRVRMGIQSGSQRMMDFYDRPASRKKVIDTANLLISKYPKVAPPEFDFIMDNPVENDNDKKETLELLDSLNTPYIPLISSLRTVPGTNLRKYADEHPEIPFIPLENSFRLVVDDKHSLRVYIYGLGKPSKIVKSFVEFVVNYPKLLHITLKITVLLSLGRRLYYDLRMGNMSTFSAAFPNIPRLLYKLGLLRFFQAYRKFAPSK